MTDLRKTDQLQRVTRDRKNAKRQMAKLGIVALAVGSVLGFSLDSIGLLPVPDIDVQWVVPAMAASDYAPGAPLAPGDETVLVYVGSSTCGWSNVPELSSMLRSLKSRMHERAIAKGRRFAAIGIARDVVAADGIAHLAKFGAFDEVMAGNSWGNRGIQQYIYGTGDMAGPAATPQVIVVSRKLEYSTGHVSIADERVVLRKTGLDAILHWIADGAPVSFEDKPSEDQVGAGR